MEFYFERTKFHDRQPMGGVIPLPLSMAAHGEADSSRAHPHATAAAAAEERRDMVRARDFIIRARRLIRQAFMTPVDSATEKYSKIGIRSAS
jgi:hypothetical protein